MHLSRFIRSYWPILVLVTLVLLLFFTNYVPGTFLTGWDNLHPEFYFSMNIQRSIFAVWQEYQGLGLLGGMGHASDLVRQLILLLFSLILPLSLLRYTWTFLMVLSGSIGAYYLIKLLCNHVFSSAEKPHEKMTAFYGAVYYLLSWATMQTFYAPFEAFIAHYGFLPWLLFASLQYYLKPTKKTLVFFCAVLLLATPQAYIPTLFVVYVMAVTILIGTMFVWKRVADVEGSGDAQIVEATASLRSSTGGRKHLTGPFSHELFHILKLYTLIILINAFWLLPFAYFTATSVSVNLNSRINQMATASIFDQNKAFGDIWDVMIIKGFWFNNVDPNASGQYDYMLKAWRAYAANPLVIVVAYLLFGIVALGVYKAIKRQHPFYLAFVVLFFFVLTAMATATPPFSWVNVVFREALPVLNQAFRFPFTKFSILTALTFAVFFGIGVTMLFQKFEQLLHQVIPKHFSLRIKQLNSVTIGVFAFISLNIFVLYALPSFQGHFFYEKERLAIPNEYFQMFDYFKQQDPNTRIANFPQINFWGWGYYKWGYGGSGFLWYGIRQPIIDRAFDVWSTTDENYYYELSTAMNQKDPKRFLDVLNKYKIGFLLVDKNVINPGGNNETFLPLLESILQKIPNIQKDATFGHIDIYKVKLADKPTSYVYTTPLLPSINPYTWTEVDNAYDTVGNYITADSQTPTAYSFPFRSLFSQKTQKEKAYTLKENSQTIDVVSNTQIPSAVKTLNIPSLSETENIVPVDISVTTTSDGTAGISLTLSSPTILLGNTKIYGDVLTQQIFSVSDSVSYPLSLNINGVKTYVIKNSTTGYVGTTFLSLKQDNIIVLSDASTARQTQTIPAQALATLPLFQGQQIQLPSHADATLRVQVPKIADDYISFVGAPTNKGTVTNCNQFSEKGKIKTEEKGNRKKRFVAFSSSDATACIAFYSSTMPHNQGYGLFVDNENVKGRGFHFWVLNEDEQSSPIDTYLPSDKNQNIATFLIPPMEDFGKAYSFHVENIAIGPAQVENNLTRLAVYPMPYNFLTHIQTGSLLPNRQLTGDGSWLTVSHPNESLYEVKGAPAHHMLVLSQSYNNGWTAYTVSPNADGMMRSLQLSLPFVFGKKVSNHVKINNWENGWYVPDDADIIIVYLPQYLEYIGFLCILGVGLWLLRKKTNS